MVVEAEKNLAPDDAPSRAYVFGPVRSRRLGMSLGIDPIPLKTCNWNCVYCQLGRTVPLQHARAEYGSTDKILLEVDRALSAQEAGRVDWVTFVGSGEPLLHANIGKLVRGVQELTDLPVAVITNGALLSDPEVRGELVSADAVLPTLDAGTPELYRRINRPHPSVPFQDHVNGLKAFRRQYRGRFLLEVMLVKGMNDSEEALRSIGELAKEIGPDEVHISLPERPPAERWVEAASEEGVMRASAILGDVAWVLHPGEGVLVLDESANALETILAIIGRHPLSESQLLEALAAHSSEHTNSILGALEECEQAKRIRRHGGTFWVSSSARFPDSAGAETGQRK
jgi:wyosine [tRNA(Phe)-imidazoG37] synthetase (radical SAM superfamily)